MGSEDLRATSHRIVHPLAAHLAPLTRCADWQLEVAPSVQSTRRHKRQLFPVNQSAGVETPHLLSEWIFLHAID